MKHWQKLIAILPHLTAANFNLVDEIIGGFGLSIRRKDMRFGRHTWKALSNISSKRVKLKSMLHFQMVFFIFMCFGHAFNSVAGVIRINVVHWSHCADTCEQVNELLNASDKKLLRPPSHWRKTYWNCVRLCFTPRTENGMKCHVVVVHVIVMLVVCRAEEYSVMRRETERAIIVISLRFIHRTQSCSYY